MDAIRQMAATARRASRELAPTSCEQRNNALDIIACHLESQRERILTANAKDIQDAEALVAAGQLEAPLLKRLKLDAKLDGVIDMVRSVRAQADPLWDTQASTELATELELYRVTVPIGVIGVIFESRPDALVQIASLCLKSGNAVLLKGGREAKHSNRVLADIIIEATTGLTGIPAGWLGLLETRDDVNTILELEHDIDLLIPRGSNEFVSYIMSHTNIPVMGHADGVCHVYVDRDADIDKATRIVVDSKTQYVAVCNAAETLLVHADVAATMLPPLLSALTERGVAIRGDERTQLLAPPTCSVVAATEDDWTAEYLDYVIAVRVVDNIHAAIDHINEYGSHHTDAIVTENGDTARLFLTRIDSASVVHNASTRFADGYRYGLGAEVGISTSRLHSRGPVGLQGLTTYKYLLLGNGQGVDDFEGSAPRPYSHRAATKRWQ